MVAVKEINLQMLCLVARRLEPLLDRLVFLGGCTTALFITDEAAPDVRVTHDVDGITLDVMPTDESILGFSNRWYSDAINYAETVSLNEDFAIQLVTPRSFYCDETGCFFRARE